MVSENVVNSLRVAHEYLEKSLFLPQDRHELIMCYNTLWYAVSLDLDAAMPAKCVLIYKVYCSIIMFRILSIGCF